MNKILINAARYIEAIHDIKVDEKHPRLDSIIRKYVLEFETPELINYWKAYLADIDIENANTEIRESVQEVEEVEKAVFYRGVKVEQDAAKTTKPKKQVFYRGAAIDEPAKDSSKRNKPQPVYRGIKSK